MMPNTIQPHHSLHNKLVSFWNMEGPSGGVWLDSAPNNTLKSAPNNLTPTNTPTAVAGKIGNAGSFVRASSQNITMTANSSTHAIAGVGLTITAWVNLTTAATNERIVQEVDSGPTRDYFLTMSQSLGWQFAADDSTQGHLTGVIAPGGVPSTSTWYFLAAWYDPSGTPSLNIQVNNGVVTSTGFGFNINTGATAFTIGGANIGINAFMNGLIDAVGLWKRVLTAQEITWLYRAGNGVQFPFA